MPSSATVALSILPLYVELRSQLSLDASSLEETDHFSTAMGLIGAASNSFSTTFELQSFLRKVGGFNQSLNDRILNLSPDIIVRDPDVIRAWAELLSLRKLPHPQLEYSEAVIWSAVDHLVSIATSASQRSTPTDHLSGSTATCSPITPRKHPPQLQDDTPVHANSALPFNTRAQTHAQVDPYLRTELRDTVLKDVRGFATFFDGITEAEWTCAVTCPPICACQWPEPVYNNRALEVDPVPTPQVPHFPSNKNPSESSVLDWFASFNEVFLSPRGFYPSPTRALSHSNSSSKRQCDLFLAKPIASPGGTHGWHDVLVPAELKASPSADCTSDTIIQLASYVREVFGAQFNRRFVHAFTICGPYFRCYLFDRAGVSISQRLCITKNDRTQALLARILAGYMYMSAQELGFDTNYLYPENTDPDGPVSCMPTLLAPNPKYLRFGGRKFRLIKTLFHRAVIVSRGTLCWLAQDVLSGEECVIKDSWRASWRTSEGRLLQLAGDRGVLGITQPVVYGDVKIASNVGDNYQVDSIDSLRSGLSYSSAIRVILPMKPADGLYFLSSTKCVPVNAEATGSAKRRSGDPLGSENRKAAKPNSNSENRKAAKPNSISQSKTSSTQTRTTGASKSSRSSKANSYNSRSATKSEWSQACRQPTSTAVTPGTTTEYSTLVDPSCPPGGFMQLTHSVIVTSLVGERIEKFGSIRELLEAYRDAIRCHQSLIELGRILHRDISPNNVMIHRSQFRSHPPSPRGFLIDLDLAKELPPNIAPPTTPSSLRRRTGTMFFMAIEILKGTAPRHTWRHDLESFLYVLIWICVCCPEDSNANSCTLLEACWSAKGAAESKFMQISHEGEWEKLMGYFAPSMRERMPKVARRIRDELFPVVQGGRGVDIGTGSDMGAVYEAILVVLEDEIASLRNGE